MTAYLPPSPKSILGTPVSGTIGTILIQCGNTEATLNEFRFWADLVWIPMGLQRIFNGFHYGCEPYRPIIYAPWGTTSKPSDFPPIILRLPDQSHSRTSALEYSRSGAIPATLPRAQCSINQISDIQWSKS